MPSDNISGGSILNQAFGHMTTSITKAKAKRDLSMRTVHIVTSLDFGGVEKRMLTLSATAADVGFSHQIFAIGKGGAVADQLLAMGASVKCLEQPTRIPSLEAVLALYRTLRTVAPDVVHTHGAEANFHGLMAAWLAGIPVRVAEEIGIPAHSKNAKNVFRQIYRLAHCVIGISDSVKDWLVESGEVPIEKAVRIYNPVQMPTECNPGVGGVADIFRIGFVGRLEPVKNPGALIDAVAILRKNCVPAELWIIGDGSQRSTLMQQAVLLRVSDHVHFFGYREDPASYIRECNVYVQPSLSEGFGLALVEAMGCGVPVFATAVGGAPEIITHGETGWLLEQSTPRRIVEYLRQAWLNPAHLASVGEAGREAVLRRFEPAAYVHELATLYRKIQEKKKPR